MVYFIVIRGPAGVGKSSVAERLANILNGVHISFDKIMKENHLDTIVGDGISAENFIKANELVIPIAKKELKNNKVVVFDGCFYRKEQLQHLEKELKYKHYVFSLGATLKDCIARNKTRKKSMSDAAIEEVFVLVYKISPGVIIPTSGKSINEVAYEIKSLLI